MHDWKSGIATGAFLLTQRHHISTFLVGEFIRAVQAFRGFAVMAVSHRCNTWS
jgi:hypothetical protein